MVTIVIILITALVSVLCFYGRLNADALVFNAYSVWHRKQWWRMLTHGLVFPLAFQPAIFTHFLSQLGF